MNEPDDLAELLNPKALPTNQLQLRAAILRKTTPKVIYYKRLRRAKLAALAVAILGVGIITGWMLKLVNEPEKIVQTTINFAPPPPEFSAPPPNLELLGSTAEEIELYAENSADPIEAARLYRLAGDRFLDLRSDYPQASRCYRLHLLAAGPAAQRVSLEDNWLLISMKQANASENIDETKTDS